MTDLERAELTAAFEASFETSKALYALAKRLDERLQVVEEILVRQNAGLVVGDNTVKGAS